MQPASAWAAVSDQLAERYSSVLLDHGRAHLRGPAGASWPRPDAERCCAATRWAGGWHCTPWCATRATTRGWSRSAPRRASRNRRPAPSGPRTDEKLASWMETQPIEAIVDVWERQPLFADQSDALVEAQRPGRLAQDPRVAGADPAHGRPGRAGAGVAAAARAGPAGAWPSPATATSATPRPRGGWRVSCPAARRRDRRARGPRAPAPAAGRGGAAASRVPRPATSARASADTSSAQARALGNAHQPVGRARAGSAPGVGVEQLQRGQAASQAQVGRRRQLQGGGDAPRAVQRAGQPGRQVVLTGGSQRIAGGPVAARGGQLHVHGVAGAELGGPVHVLGAGDGLVGGHGDLTRARAPRPAPPAWGRAARPAPGPAAPARSAPPPPGRGSTPRWRPRGWPARGPPPRAPPAPARRRRAGRP